MKAFDNLLSKAVHGDSRMRERGDVAPPIHVTTTRTHSKDPEHLHAHNSHDAPPDDDVYSREGHPNCKRVEATLSELLGGHCVAYSSGLSAYNALLLLKTPKRLFIGDGYFGIQAVARISQRSGLEIHPLEKIEELAENGDFVHVESLVNPTAIAPNIRSFAKRAHDKGAILVVDATFAPPPLQAPFELGADIIIHSASKYLGGHSDVLAGVLVTKSEKEAYALLEDRASIGTIIPPLTSWLLLRSLKTYPLRIKQQSANVNAIVKFLSDNQSKLSKLTNVYHSNLQSDQFVASQLPHGGSPTFSIEVTDEQTAKEVPSNLKLFYHVTSLGDVHSTIEWRAAIDENAKRNLLRLSIGIEDTDELIADLKQALE